MANTTGKKWGGRVKGTPNKVTATVKEAFKVAFEEMGGAPALAKWGMENPTEFYKLASKLIPTEVSGPEGKPLEILWPLPPTKLDE